jgi:hypothetical protein
MLKISKKYDLRILKAVGFSYNEEQDAYYFDFNKDANNDSYRSFMYINQSRIINIDFVASEHKYELITLLYKLNYILEEVI